MQTDPMELITAFPVRKSTSERKAFRDAVLSYAQAEGYTVKESNGNLFLGNLEQAVYLLIARGHVSSAVLTLLEIARTLPPNQRQRVCLAILDRSGSVFWGQNPRQTVLYLDHVGFGDHIRMIPTPKLRKDRKRLTSFYKACGYFGKKDILVLEKGLTLHPHRGIRFPFGMQITVMKQGKLASYPEKVPSSPRSIDVTNVNILRAALTTFICCDGVN